jgi:hypothetical protein
MIPPDFAPARGLPDQKRTIAAIRGALEQAKPGKAVFLSSIGSEQPSGLGLITSTHLMEQATRSLEVPVAYLRAECKGIHKAARPLGRPIEASYRA